MANKKNSQTNKAPQGVGFKVTDVPVYDIFPSLKNPRRDIDEDSVKELAESIKIYGILQPVIIRPNKDIDTMADSPWEMVCGHRRLKACELLGLETIPAIIRDDMTDAEAYDLMIVENLQRQDLSPLDEAVAYKALYNGNSATGNVAASIQELAARFGKSEKYIRGRLSLNDLISALKDCLKAGTLTLGAALRLATLPENMQSDFYKSTEPATSKTDDSQVISPMNIDDVRDYLDLESNGISRQAFSEDADEKWNTNLHKCAGCPFNSASQGALFADMIRPGECSNADCMLSKTLAYARYIFDFWWPNLKPGDRAMSPGDITIGFINDPWFSSDAAGDAQRELFESLKDRAAADGIVPIKTTQTNRLQRIWRAEDAKSRDDVFRVLNLHSLCRGGTDYIEYYVLPSQNAESSAAKEVTHSTIYSKLLSVKRECADKIHESLLPMSAAAVESYFTASATFQNLPDFLQQFITYRVFQSMSYDSRTAIQGDMYYVDFEHAVNYLKEHTLTDALKAALTDFVGEKATRNGQRMLLSIIETLADDATKATIDEIRGEFQPKIDKLVLQLNEMGYDENDNPLQNDEPDDESNENEEAES